MKKGVDIDTQREMLIYSDGRDPVSVTRDSVMTGKLCWKANNFASRERALLRETSWIMWYPVSLMLLITSKRSLLRRTNTNNKHCMHKHAVCPNNIIG